MLLTSSSSATGAQIMRSPALGVIRFSTRLTAANATTSQISQRAASHLRAPISPARTSLIAVSLGMLALAATTSRRRLRILALEMSRSS